PRGTGGSVPGSAQDSLAALPTELPPVERKATLPAGFRAGGTAAGIKASGRPDMAIIATLPDATGRAVPASAAAVFTPNAFVAAPVRLSQAHLRETSATGRGSYGIADAVISTSGCANAATGAAGDRDQAEVAALLAGSLGIARERTLLLSTGVIGTRLPLDRVSAGITYLVPRLEATDEALAAAAEALRTTDTRTKAATVTIALPDPDGLAARRVQVTGIAKGVGMIHPRMATMLAIVLTDATVEPAVLHSLLRAGAAPVRARSRAARELGLAIEAVARELARQQAADGEGATTLVTCQVSGALDDADARAVARAVISSSLVKAAVHGRDPNWGRVAGAAGNARLADAAVLEAAGMDTDEAARHGGTPAVVDPDRLRIAIAGHLVFSGGNGGPVPFDRAAARSAMDAPELLIRLDLGLGDGTGEAFGCDLTEEYVVENS